HIGFGASGLVTVVKGHQANLAAGNSALFIDMIQIGPDADFHFVAQLLGRSVEGSAHAQNDFVFRDSPEERTLASEKGAERPKDKTGKYQGGDPSESCQNPDRTNTAARGGNHRPGYDTGLPAAVMNHGGRGLSGGNRFQGLDDGGRG